jgi:serine/threonine protein kinase
MEPVAPDDMNQDDADWIKEENARIKVNHPDYYISYPVMQVNTENPTNVFRGYDTGKGINVAFKRISRKHAQQEEDNLITVDHDLVVKHEHTIKDVSTENWYLVLRWFESYPLDQYMRKMKSPLKDSDYLDLADLALRALKVVHDKGIVHSDIKPDNFLVSKDGIVPKKRGLKLNDLGLSRLILHPSSRSAGATGFRAPEALKKGMPLESDLYSMGVLLYELFTGHLRLSVSTSLSYSLVNAWDKDENNNLKELRADAHLDVLTKFYSSDKLLKDNADGQLKTKKRRLDTVIRHCLEYESKNRYHSAEGVRIDLWLSLNPELIDSKEERSLGLEAAFGISRSPEKLDAICNAYRNIILHCDTSQGDLSHSWLLKSYNDQFANYLTDGVLKELSAQCVKKRCKTVLQMISDKYCGKSSDLASIDAFKALPTPPFNEKYVACWAKVMHNPGNIALLNFFSNYKVVPDGTV